MQLQGNIRVFCRVRPFMESDSKSGDKPLEVGLYIWFLYTSIYLYIYTYMDIYMCMYVCICMDIYVGR